MSEETTMTTLKVTFGALDDTAADISTSSSRLAQRLADLESDLQPLQADWTGEASQAYQQARAEWHAALDELGRLLSAVGGAVRRSNADYLGAERSNAARW
jgi:early secretory antigenic target protein ESAT-6